MSTDSSPSPDDVDKSKRNRSRKPDIQLYVPRAKRIENQVKQKNTNFEKDANVVDAENLQVDSFFNLIDDDHNSMLVMMNNNDNSSQCGVNWKPNPSWFNSSSSQDCSSYFPVRDNILNETTSNDAVYETDRTNFSPKDGRIGKNVRSKYGRSSQDDDFSCVPTMTFQRQQTSSSDKFFRKPSLPQPDPRKLPHQQIEAMLKMYNIKKDPIDDDSTKNPMAPMETVEATDGCFVAPHLAVAVTTTNLNENIFRSNVPCSLNLPVDESNGLIVYDDRRSSTTTSPSTYWMTADVIDQLTGGGDSGVNEFFPSSDVKSTNPTMMLNKNEADSILDSLPTSYDEFESKDLTTKKNRSNQDLVGAGVVSSSTQCSSTSPLSSVPRTPVSLVSCGGGVESIERASSSSPSMIDPDDLEVQLINESFEEQMKQAQVLSNAKTKEAFYRQPNQETSSASNLLTGVGAKTKSKSKHQIQKDFLDSSIHHQQQQNTTNIQTSTTSSRCEGQIIGGVKQGLTWAGWGAGATAGGGDNPNSLLTTPKHESSGGSAGSTAAALTKKSSSGSIGSSSSSLEATNTVAAAVSSSASISKLDYYEETDDDMDELSKAMIDKLLSCDDDDDDSFKYGANKTVVQTSNVAAVDRTPTTTTSTSYKSSFDDECLQPSNSSAVSNKTWSTAPTSTTASVADSWEDILDSNCVPDFNSAVEQTSLDDLPKIDYLQFKPKDTSFDDKEYGHVLEAYDFPSSTKAETLHLAIQQLDCKHFNIQWVDETHALIICTDKFAANVVLDGSHPVIKVRPLSEASVQSKRKAKEFPVLRSNKPKPERTSFVARRLVESHLGKKTSTSTDQRLEERKKIERAKEQKKFIAQMREDVWEGRV